MQRLGRCVRGGTRVDGGPGGVEDEGIQNLQNDIHAQGPEASTKMGKGESVKMESDSGGNGGVIAVAKHF